MPIQRIKCEQCGREIANYNYEKHLMRHKNNPQSFNKKSWKVEHDGLECQYCGCMCKNRNSLCNHERLCSENPDRDTSSPFQKGVTAHNKGVPSPKKGHTKETDPSIQKQVDTFRERFNAGMYSLSGRRHSEETKQKLRTIALNSGCGGINHKCVIIYNGVKLDSSYELVVAKELDANGIQWSRPKRLSYYSPDGTKHRYTPDFYLPQFNVYLDPKNDYLIQSVNPHTKYKDVDKIKWVSEQHNVTIIILDREHLTWDKIYGKITECNSNSIG